MLILMVLDLLIIQEQSCHRWCLRLSDSKWRTKLNIIFEETLDC